MSSQPATVTAVVISHNGARWLPAVLAGLKSQTAQPDCVTAVDTGSSDASARLLRDSLGDDVVQTVPDGSTYDDALDAALSATPAAPSDRTEWLWLLHDDSAPAPEALEHLLAAVRANPSVSVLGPKLREWPSLRRLLEVGVTISGTGRRETGLERGEYDQGQHDQVREVLAVNTAGMLVRRDVFEALGGLDPNLPMFGNDIDFGWRAARAGHRTLVVPDAVVFHVEAAHRSVRDQSVTAHRTRRAERRSALYTLLVNCSLVALPFQVVRLFAGSLVRAGGLLVLRAPGEAWDEVLALLTAYARPDRVVRGRSRRRATATVGPREVRHLLAAPWVPYRHGLDFVTDIAAAVAMQAGEVSSRRSARLEESETGPVPAEAQNLPADSGVLTRVLGSPVAAVLALLVVLAGVAARDVLGSGMLSGGALLPAPGSTTTWWDSYLESWHTGGVGSDAPAAAYLLPLALVGTLLAGKAWLVVDVLFLLAVPLAAWGALRFFRAISGSRYATLWGAVTYGLLPVVGGAVNQGRLGTVAAAVVLPWLAHAALFLRPGGPADRRWRAAWRTSLLLALLSSFVPIAWLLAAVLAVATIAVGLVTGHAGWRRASVWGPVAAAVVVALALLLPWSLQSLLDGRGAVSWLFEAGVPVELGAAAVTGWDLVVGRAGDVGAAPGWIGLGIAVVAVGALLRPDVRRQVLLPWMVLLAALVTSALLAGRSFELAGTPAPVWIGFPLLLAQASAITAGVVAATGISRQFSGSSFGWRQPVALVVVVTAVLTPLAGLGWWAVTGVSAPLDRRPAANAPAYMIDAARSDPAQGVLVLRGNLREGLEYTLLRGDGQRLGDFATRPDAGAQEDLSDAVRDLATSSRAEDVEALSRRGVEFVFAPAPADNALAGRLDSAGGLVSASAVNPAARAWQLEPEPSMAALPQPANSGLRPWLLGLQAVVLVLVLVLAAPSRRTRS